MWRAARRCPSVELQGVGVARVCEEQKGGCHVHLQQSISVVTLWSE